MGRKHEAVSLLMNGYSPSKIAKKMGVTVSTVMGYLYNQVGEGNIRRSDILFSIDPKTRSMIEDLISELNTTYWFDIYKFAEEKGIKLNKDDLKIYLQLRDARVAFGDMYEFIREIETILHNVIKKILIHEYGENWWRKGVPTKVRVACVTAFEEDTNPSFHPYCYTNLIHLKEIINKQWKIFSKYLPKKIVKDKHVFLCKLAKLNQIRNRVMHPVRGDLDEKDFVFIREFREYLELEKWKRILGGVNE